MAHFVKSVDPNHMVPPGPQTPEPHLSLLANICLWKGACQGVYISQCMCSSYAANLMG